MRDPPDWVLPWGCDVGSLGGLESGRLRESVKDKFTVLKIP